MSTQIQHGILDASAYSAMPPAIIHSGESREVKRFVAYPDERYFAVDALGGMWYGAGRGRAKLWPYLVTA